MPRWGFEDLHWPFGQFSAIGPAFRVLWWLYEGPGNVETKTFPLDGGRYNGCIYEPRFGKCPLHIRANSIRASTWAWSRGMSIQDICLAAGWSSQNTFDRFYKLDIQSLASQVRSVSSWFMLLPLFVWCAACTVLLYAALYDVVIIVGPEFSAVYMVVLCYADQHSFNTVQPLQYCYCWICSALFSEQPMLSLTRYANLVYLGCRRSLAYLHLSAVRPSYERRYWWEWCVFYLASVNWYRLPVASLTAGLNI